MSIVSLLNALPGAVAQGLIWGIMAIGVYHLPYPGHCGSDCGWYTLYRRCCMYYDDAEWT